MQTLFDTNVVMYIGRYPKLASQVDKLEQLGDKRNASTTRGVQNTKRLTVETSFAGRRDWHGP